MFYQKKYIDKVKTGNLLMRSIAESEISYDQLAVKLELTSSRVIYDWVSGKKLPSIENLVNLAIILNKKIEDLIIYK